ncbi:MAG: MFS transporter [Rhodobacteraceae bacterium]|nr:MFS transporter [Paracoccaceae bacterium]
MNLSALKSGNFRTYLAGNLCALNPLWMLRVTVGWIAWDITGSASFVGLIAFLYFSPAMVAGPIFGVLADRINLRHASLITQSVQLCLALSLLVLNRLETLGQVQLVAYAAAAGLTLAANGPIRMSLGPRLVERPMIGSVVMLTAANFNLARLTGPAIGGWLIARYGVDGALVVIAACYLPFLAALSVIRLRSRSSQQDAPPAFFAALMEGITHVRGHAVIRQALFLSALVSFFLRGTLEILPVLADGVLNRGAAWLGMLTSAAGFGALLGGLTVAVLTGRSPAPLPMRVYAMTGLGLLGVSGLGLNPTWLGALVLVGAVGFFATAIGIFCQSVIQMDVDDNIRGRVMSIWGMVGIGSAAAGGAVLGIFSDLLGFSTTLPAAAGLALAAQVWRQSFRGQAGFSSEIISEQLSSRPSQQSDSRNPTRSFTADRLAE